MKKGFLVLLIALAATAAVSQPPPKTDDTVVEKYLAPETTRIDGRRGESQSFMAKCGSLYAIVFVGNCSC
ncbi:MAG: hypothetical protein K2R98_11055 [Gemmataceae bacterium]|nr:hypothetical protein [Gemmataceae bacterium]